MGSGGKRREIKIPYRILYIQLKLTRMVNELLILLYIRNSGFLVPAEKRADKFIVALSMNEGYFVILARLRTM